MADSAESVQNALALLGSVQRAANSARFFKTGPGQYGAGDQFRGVSVPEQRVVARQFQGLELAEIAKLLHSPWHEDRLTALLVLVKQYQGVSSARKLDLAKGEQLFQFYVKHVNCVNNWDLVDSSAPQLVGVHLLGKGTEARRVLDKWLRSKSLWQRRVAVLATSAFIRAGQYELTLEFAARLLTDSEDLMHKAVGWMLREVGKRDVTVLRGFLDLHQTQMPRTMLRYALEKLPKAERERRLRRPGVGDGKSLAPSVARRR